MPPCCSGHTGPSPQAGARVNRSCVELPPRAVIQTHLRAVQFTAPDTNLPSLLHSPLVQRPLNITSHYSLHLENTKQGKNRAASTSATTATKPGAVGMEPYALPLHHTWGTALGDPPVPGDSKPGLHPQPEQPRAACC